MNKADIPNILTCSRLVFALWVTVFVCLGFIYKEDQPRWFGIASLCVLISGITDWLDGYLARKWNCTSNFGKTFDPVADKITLLIPILLLTCFGNINWIIGIPLVLRDIVMDAIRIYMWKKGVYVSAIKLAKWKTVFQFVGVFFILLSAPLWGNGFLFLALICSLISFFMYIRDLSK